ncbi:hypothetical protein E4U57_007771 [Claviceps arundinis]|uniref:Uncharacterized protein n=1 Tax=Claviceps arundinis TaxID=1623583 RepID=A0ABQ7PEB6_9HYPO|nr:hypothetical protein E4U57_007771 [Claviceps arundinis]
MVFHQPSPASTTVSRLTLAVSQLLLSRDERASYYVSQNEFPVFSHTGDVEIIIRVGAGTDGVDAIKNTYLLHQHTLARCSGFFETSTSSPWSKAQPVPATVNKEVHALGVDASGLDDSYSVRFAVDGGGCFQNASGCTSTNRRWRYELNYGTAHGDVPMLVQTDPLPARKGETGRAGGSQSSSQSLFGSGAGDPFVSHRTSSSLRTSHSHSVASLAMLNRLSTADRRLLCDYDNLFRIFYNRRPVLDGVDLKNAYSQCKSLLKLADQYDALTVVGPCVDYHLLQFQSRLWEHVAMYAVSYLRLGYLARSKLIFKEAFIHVVGNSCLRPPGIVSDMVENKRSELRDMVGRVDGQLFRLNLPIEHGVPVGNHLDWLVVSLFRQWLADNITPQPQPEQKGKSDSSSHNASNVHNIHHDNENSPAHMPPIGSTTSIIAPSKSISCGYQLLGSTNPSAFLDYNDCNALLRHNSQLWTSRKLDLFVRRMTELKALARDLVLPLLRCSLQLDLASSIGTGSMFYFTCTTLKDDDLPWQPDP